MPSSGASAAPGAPDEEPSRDRCIALYAWFFPISPSPPGPTNPDWNRKGEEKPGYGGEIPFRCGLVRGSAAVSYDCMVGNWMDGDKKGARPQ